MAVTKGDGLMTIELLAKMREQIAARKARLQAAYDEYVALEAANVALGDIIEPPAEPPRRGRPPGVKSK